MAATLEHTAATAIDTAKRHPDQHLGRIIGMGVPDTVVALVRSGNA